MTANPFANMLRDAIVSGMRIATETPIEQVPAAIDAAVLASLAAVSADLAEAGEVLEGVTPGPWKVSRLADYTPHSIQASYGCINGLSAWFTLAHINVPDESEVGMTDGAFSPETADANARFIAWCREGVPALIALATAQAARIEGLEAERDEAEQRGYANAMEAERKLHEAALAAIEEAKK